MAHLTRARRYAINTAMRSKVNRYPVGTSVRCYREGEAGRVGVVREATGNVPGHWRYRVEWTDGKTPAGYPNVTTVGAVNVVGRSDCAA